MTRLGRRIASGVLATLLLAAAPPAIAQTAVLRGLDKVTGHARDFNAPVGRTVRFGTLEITVRACEKRPATEAPEVSIYMEVTDAPPAATDQEPVRNRLFSGWIFASSPGINALEHPVYDVWAIDCRS
jgi:hypothetical protein